LKLRQQMRPRALPKTCRCRRLGRPAAASATGSQLRDTAPKQACVNASPGHGTRGSLRRPSARWFVSAERAPAGCCTEPSKAPSPTAFQLLFPRCWCEDGCGALRRLPAQRHLSEAGEAAQRPKQCRCHACCRRGDIHCQVGHNQKQTCRAMEGRLLS
jgi:hypothetical protein